MMRPILSAVVTAVVGALLYFLSRLYQVRKEMEKLPKPSPPRTSFLLGNLAVAADCQQHFPPKAHPHAWCRYIQKKYNLGDFFYVDLWPIGPRWLFITDPEIASQWITTGQVLNKSLQVKEYLSKLLGSDNMVSLDGPAWKRLRTMFNPGFQSGHLMTLLPYMVDMTVIFCEKLREAAQAGRVIEMEEYAAKLTIDIMGKIVLDADFNAQNAPNAIVETFRKQVELMPPAASVNPLENINFIRPIKLWLNGRKLDRLIGEELDKRFTSSSSPSQTNGLANGGHVLSASKPDRKRSVVDLALQTYQKEFQSTTTTTTTKPTNPMRMDPTFRTTAIDQIKTFIFAGHDTTSSTIAYAFYLLHTSPLSRARLTAELDAVLGPAATSPTTLKSSPHLINALPYTTAVFKETLRLFPPASTLRYASDSDSDLTFTDPATGTRYPLAGYEVWPASTAIHRNERYFPRPLEFVPERFMPTSSPEYVEFLASLLPTTSSSTTTPPPAIPIHKDSFRPFEKGPRNCIGQELAVLETKVILALSVREFDFACRYPEVEVEVDTDTKTKTNTSTSTSGAVRSSSSCRVLLDDGSGGGVRCESVDEKTPRYTVEGHRCVQVLKGSAKPLGGMPGVVLLLNQ